MAERCTFKREYGDSCQAYPMKDSTLCFLHNPEVRDRAALAQRKGGLGQVVVLGQAIAHTAWPKKIHLKRPRDVRKFVSLVMNEVRTGQVDSGLANCLFVGANVLLKTFDAEAIERIEALEQAAKERGLIQL